MCFVSMRLCFVQRDYILFKYVITEANLYGFSVQEDLAGSGVFYKHVLLGLRHQNCIYKTWLEHIKHVVLGTTVFQYDLSATKEDFVSKCVNKTYPNS